ncbi:Hypothetical predicted protein [Paramuricea clavata]|uniref:Uncharacterized protein n=1 Tax=Paramuricea clavata TaxID=317549 RepID=A0A7D9LCT8_PARCT|nr:Hypothetical predicted protein [Paramuricea clavata]
MADDSQSNSNVTPDVAIHQAGIGDQGESINRVQIEKIVAETVAKNMPIMLTSFLASTGFQPQQIVNQAPQQERDGTPESSPPPLRSERCYSKDPSTTITDDLIELSRKAFSTALSREKWLELVQSYPTIKDTDSFLIDPKLEAGMKEALPALMALDYPGDEGDGPDPADSIKDYLEDALVMLGNAHVRLNNWRQRRFSEFLTDIGKRTLKEGIPTDKHLFPDKFHEKIKDDRA